MRFFDRTDRRWSVTFFTAIAFCVCAVFACAGQVEETYDNGEVLYHQDFTEISDIRLSGIWKGSASSDNSALLCNNETFSICTYDDNRVYAILPDAPWTDSFTAEFTFSFTEIASQNGYLSFMLTASGEKPDNITSVRIRANGSVDHFEAVSEEMAGYIQSGEEITVKIPVEDGILHEITLSSNGSAEVLERDSIIVIGSGSRGFAMRNASAAISEVYLVNGVGYTEKTGYWAENSYIEDDVVMVEEETVEAETVKEKVPPEGEVAPPTDDAVEKKVVVLLSVCAASAYGLKKLHQQHE